MFQLRFKLLKTHIYKHITIKLTSYWALDKYSIFSTPLSNQASGNNIQLGFHGLLSAFAPSPVAWNNCKSQDTSFARICFFIYIMKNMSKEAAKRHTLQVRRGYKGLHICLIVRRKALARNTHIARTRRVPAMHDATGCEENPILLSHFLPLFRSFYYP